VAFQVTFICPCSPNELEVLRRYILARYLAQDHDGVANVKHLELLS
jgi:hypothetical protein